MRLLLLLRRQKCEQNEDKETETNNNNDEQGEQRKMPSVTSHKAHGAKGNEIQNTKCKTRASYSHCSSALKQHTHTHTQWIS